MDPFIEVHERLKELEDRAPEPGELVRIVETLKAHAWRHDHMQREHDKLVTRVWLRQQMPIIFLLCMVFVTLSSLAIAAIAILHQPTMISG